LLKILYSISPALIRRSWAFIPKTVNVFKTDNAYIPRYMPKSVDFRDMAWVDIDGFGHEWKSAIKNTKIIESQAGAK
jgi:hypothetical protein